MRRFFAPVDQISDGRVALNEVEARHARDVLRLKVNDEVSVFDGEGREYLCRFDSIEKRSATLIIESEVQPAAPESPLNLTLAAVILKGDKTDTVVQKAVELGVTRFVPLISVRCEARFNDGDKKLARWQRIALDAAKQCGRARLMTVEPPARLDAFLNDNDEGSRLFFAERSGTPFGKLKAGKTITAVIGPEGGWDDDEIGHAAAAGYTVVTFGGRILRAETAAVAIASILQHQFGDLN